MNPCCLNTNCKPLSLDPQLLQERQFWRSKYTQLRSQFESETKSLKDSIYAECTKIMQSEFINKQAIFQQEIDFKNQSLAAMAVKCGSFEAKLIQLTNQNQQLEQQIQTLNQKLQRKRISKQQLRVSLQAEIDRLKRKNQQQINRIIKQHDEQIESINRNHQNQLAELKRVLLNYQQKLKAIISQAQKVRNTVACKQRENDQLKSKIRELQSRTVVPLPQKERVVIQRDQQQIRLLRKQIQQKDSKIRKLKEDQKPIIKKEVKVQTVIVEKPVQKPVYIDKIVTVQKIVKEYIQPQKPIIVQEVNCGQNEQVDYSEYEAAIKKKSQKIKILQNDLQYRQSQLKNQQNYSASLLAQIQKYKAQRVKLVGIISQKNSQISGLQGDLQMLSYQQGQAPFRDNQRIIVNVKNDGTVTTAKNDTTKVKATAKKL